MSDATRFEHALTGALERHLTQSDGATPPNLAEAIRYSLLAPGKRIRPRLLLACARLVGLSSEAALPAAVALEMIHCFTLIHDDLPCMDNDDFRRGRPSNHKVHGEALALLAGDALIPLALDSLTDAAPFVAPQHWLQSLKRLSWASGPRGVIGGQAAESLLLPQSSLDELKLMHAMKTGALFSAALLLAKDLAGISDDETKGRAIHTFAAGLGLAFQAADDLEDGEKEASKPTSLLFHLPHEKARELALGQLRESVAALQQAWGETASAELMSIAHEVERALQEIH
jgi:geranylgeranyl diphosphate synthase type II